MAERSPKAKSVLGTLPATRPERLGAPRREAARPKRRPRAVTPAAAELPSVHEPLPRAVEPPKGTELVTTALRATGELAQIGVTLGGQALKRALHRR